MEDVSFVRLQRNRGWIEDLDDAFWQSQSELLSAAGPGFEHAPIARLEQNSWRYSAFRRALLRGKQCQTWRDQCAGPTARRFGRWSLEESASRSEAGGADGVNQPRSNVFPDNEPSYWQWRRALLSRRFQLNRTAVETMVLQRRAAEAMRRALSAEREERERFADSDEASSDEEPASAPGSSSWARLTGRRFRLGVPRALTTWYQGPEFGRGSAAEAAVEAREEEHAMEDAKRRVRATSSADASAGLREALLMDLPPPPSCMPPSSLQETRSRRRSSADQARTRPPPRGSAEAPAPASANTPPIPRDRPFAGRVPRHMEQLRGVTALAFPRETHREASHDTGSSSSSSSSSSSHFAHGAEDGAVGLSHAPSGWQWARLRRHASAVTALDWDPTSTYLVSASLDQQVLVWHVTFPLVAGEKSRRGDAVCVRVIPRSEPVTHVRFSPLWPNLCFLACSKPAPKLGWFARARRGAHRSHAPYVQSNMGVLEAVNLSTGRTVQEVETTGMLTALEVGHNGQSVFAADTLGRLLEWEVTMDPAAVMRAPVGKRYVRLDPTKGSRRGALATAGREEGDGRLSEAGSIGGPRGALSARGSLTGGGGSTSVSTMVGGTARTRACWVSLRHRPYDSSFRCGVLVGLDSMGHVRAVRLDSDQSAPSGAEVAYAAQRFAERDVCLAGPHSAVLPSRHSDCILLAAESGTVLVVDPHARVGRAAVVARLEGHVRPVTAVAWSDDDAWVLTGDESGAILSWRHEGVHTEEQQHE